MQQERKTKITCSVVYQFHKVHLLTGLSVLAAAGLLADTGVAASPDFLWARGAGTRYLDAGQSVAVDAAGNVYVTGGISALPGITVGDFGETNLVGCGGGDIFVAKYSPAGDLRWVRQAGGPGMDWGYGIAVDQAGNSFVTGRFTGTAFFDGHVRVACGLDDVFVAKLSPSGDFDWVIRAGGPGEAVGYSIALDGADALYVTGWFDGDFTFGDTTLTSRGSADNFLAKCDTQGNLLWLQQAGGPGIERETPSVTVDGSGNCYWAGLFSGTATVGEHVVTGRGERAVFLAKLDPSGDVKWATKADAYLRMGGLQVAAAPAGYCYLAGFYTAHTGNATFGNFTVYSHDQPDQPAFDIYLAQYDTDGNCLWVRDAGGTYSDGAMAVACDSSGNAYITGVFSYTVAFRSATVSTPTTERWADVFVVKYDPSGEEQWVKRAGGVGDDEAYDIAVDQYGNCYLTGIFGYGDPYCSATFGTHTVFTHEHYDMFVAKLGLPDAMPPSITAPPPVDAQTDAGTCSATGVDLGTPITYDDSGVASVVNDAPAVFPKGTTIVTWTATDLSGKTATDTQCVTVADTEAPTIVCPGDITLPCSAEPLLTASYSVTATDNCDPTPAVVLSPPSGTGFAAGTSTVTATATDGGGKTATCSFTVTRAPMEFTGFLSPIGGSDVTGGNFSNPVRTFKMNSTIPVKFIAACDGTPVVTGIHTIQAIKFTDSTTPGEPIDATPQDAASTGNQFRLTDGQWHFNLDTKATGMSAGIWELVVTLSDASQHIAWVQLK